MADAPQETGLLREFVSILRAVTEGSLVLFLKNLIDAWDLWAQLKSKITYHGMYEILDYRSTLDLSDPRGEMANISRYQMIRFLQDNIVALHDHAWGDGDLFHKYHCQPGTAVDFYRDGSKWNILVSLRETKNRGDTIPFLVERTIADGFLKNNEWLETEVDHLTSHLQLSIVFPKARPCLRATLTQKTSGKTKVLDAQHFRTLGNGRQELTLAITRPKIHECYLVKWDW
jgi:hypothetical protein